MKTWSHTVDKTIIHLYESLQIQVLCTLKEITTRHLCFALKAKGLSNRFVKDKNSMKLTETCNPEKGYLLKAAKRHHWSSADAAMPTLERNSTHARQLKRRLVRKWPAYSLTRSTWRKRLRSLSATWLIVLTSQRWRRFKCLTSEALILCQWLSSVKLFLATLETRFTTVINPTCCSSDMTKTWTPV